jgi:uncharacterized protein YlxW (UPF0749 family)
LDFGSSVPFVASCRKRKKRATNLCELVEEKCKLLEKVSLIQNELKGLESSLKDASSKKVSTEVQSLEATCGELE